MFRMQLCFLLSAVMMILLIRPSYAQTACAAEANFQGCKTIQETKLSGCGPVDFACQCTAHKLIQECYNLCPSYAADATAHDGTVQSICSAVPSSSSLPLPSATSSAPASSVIASASPSPTQQQQNQQHSGASFLTPSPILAVLCGLVVLLKAITQ